VVEAFVAVGNPSQPTSYFEFEVNPLAARFSAVVDSPNLSREKMRVETFDCPGFTARVVVRERIWSALLALPLEALAGRPVTALRANFFRVDRQSGEFQALFPTFADPPDFHRPGAFGLFAVSGP
jgi:hypothetical protein